MKIRNCRYLSLPSGSFQCDLTFYKQKKQEFQGYVVLLTIIEINTRFAWVYPLKDKTADSIYRAMKNLTDNVNMLSISFDAGTEFSNKKVLGLFESKDIKVIVFNKKLQPNATMIIERFNRTLRDKIALLSNTMKKNNFLSFLKSIVDGYNNTEHSTIRMSPNSARE